jgi:PAS domain S-box-containing protein
MATGRFRRAGTRGVTGHEALAPLNQALAVAAGMRGYPAPPELLDEVAAACAAVGDFEQAYHRHLQADAARQTSRLLEAQKRALAMQVRREVESARADTEHHRQLAATLKDTAATLETLGTIGREITASLDAQAVFAVLHRRVHQLLDATAFAVYLMAAHEPELVTAFGMEAGVPLPRRHIALEHPTSHVARCARSRQEILIELEPGVTTPQHIPGTLSTYTLLYAPLMADERLLGVMTVQSSTLRAHGERERSIFTPCARQRHCPGQRAYAADAAQLAPTTPSGGCARRRRSWARHGRTPRIDQLHVLNSELEMRCPAHPGISVTLGLAESKRKLQGIVDTALDAVVRVDAQGCIVGWNRQAVALFGWSPEQALGQALHDTIIPSHYRAAHHQGMARYMTGGESRVLDRRIEISAVDRSGREFPIELSITRVMLDDPTQFEFCAFIRDITRRRQAEQDVRDSLEKQRELNQLKSRFVSMASHEFRTPLATILSSSDLLRYYADRLPVAEREELFQSITDAVKRMTRMLEDVLVIGRDDDERARFHPQPLRVDDLCARLVQEVQAQLGGAPGHELRLRVHGDAVHGRFDEALMRHIFGNLLSNAIKYSPAGGVVGFEVQCGPEAFLFEVSDCGIGIPEVDLPHLFETFHRGTNVGNIAGTGLGLAIVKRSVDQHGGTLAVHSTLGQGTRFEVRLPRTPCEPLPP